MKQENNKKLEVFNQVFSVSPLVSFVFFNKLKTWKTCKCFSFRWKTFLLKKNIFCLIFLFCHQFFDRYKTCDWNKQNANKKMYAKFKALATDISFFWYFCESLVEAAMQNFRLPFLTETEFKSFLRYCNNLREWNKQTVVEHYRSALHNNQEIM